jgi:hypothetical protein
MYKEVLLSGLLALTLTYSSAMAQTEPVPAPAGNTEQGPAPSDPSESMTPSGPMSSPPTGSMSKRAANRALIASCRSSASAKGLTGRPRRQAVLSCVRAKRPGLAARMVCRRKGKMAGLHAHTDQLRAYVRKCLGKAT